MTLSKKLTCKGTLRQVFYLSEAPTMIPILNPNTHCILLYSILIHTLKGGGGRANKREGYRVITRDTGHYFTKPVENTNMTDCLSSQ